MKDVMIDLETLGNGPDAVIVQIGAVWFDRDTGGLGRVLRLNVNPASHQKAGGKIDASTVLWWMGQQSAAAMSVMATHGQSIYDALKGLNDFLSGAECVWSHATFDFVIVQYALQQLGIKPSFGFRAARDLRTLVDLSGINPNDFTREGTHHDGLDDAIFQVKYTVAAIKKLASTGG